MNTQMINVIISVKNWSYLIEFITKNDNEWNTHNK